MLLTDFGYPAFLSLPSTDSARRIPKKLASVSSPTAKTRVRKTEIHPQIIRPQLKVDFGLKGICRGRDRRKNQVRH